jgi:hypothetical protein
MLAAQQPGAPAALPDARVQRPMPLERQASQLAVPPQAAAEPQESPAAQLHSEPQAQVQLVSAVQQVSLRALRPVAAPQVAPAAQPQLPSFV